MSRYKLLALSLVAVVPFLWPSATAYAGRGGGGGGGHGGGGHAGGAGYHAGGGGYHGGGYYGGYRGGYGYGGYGYGLGYGLGGYGGYGYGGYGSGYGLSGGYPLYATPGYGQGAINPSPTYVDPSVDPSAVPLDSRQSGYYTPETPDNTARVRIFVPADAKVWIGGEETTKSGEERTFASPALTPGKSYTYQVKAVWMKDGKQVEKTQKVKVHANETSNVTFGD